MRTHLLSGKKWFVLFGLMGVLLFASTNGFAQATITIINGDGPNEGFNDPTATAPVGGNSGTTIGQQRLIAFQHAANIWGGKLASNVQIKIFANFDPLSCTATSAVLGSAGTVFIVRNFAGTPPFPGAEFPNTWYHSALADKRAGFDLVPPDPTSSDPILQTGPDIRARFNVNIGNAGCLTGIGWYYGLDGNHGSQIDLVTVLLHEFAHGLGFSQFASVTTGAQIAGSTDVYGRQLLDTASSKTWDQMTNSERVASAINTRKVVWAGSNVNTAVPGVLSPGTPLLTVNSPAVIAGNYAVGPATFGPALSSPGVTGNVVQALDAANASGPSTTDACTALTNAAAINGNIAIVDRGTCGFTTKVKNAQNAGAIAVIVADNAAGSPPAGLGGADPTIVIPSARITLADGNTIKAQLGAGVNATMGVNLSVRAGADALGRALLYTPNPVQPGSTISHWDTIAFRNQLMEPAINSDLTHSVMPPEDLTLPQMRDVGWFPDADLDGVADELDCEPNSDLSVTVKIGGCDSGVTNTFFLTGCTINDLINHIAAGAKNHGAFVSGVAHLTEQLLADGVITAAQKDAIMSCAGKSKLP
jgi:hypothetical protein